MPRSQILLAALIPGVLLSVIAVGLFLTQKKTLPDLTGIISQNANTAAVPDAKSMTATLFKESGDVKYQLPNREFVVLAADEINLPNGSSVKTGNGLAHVIFPDNSVMSISQNSEVGITFTEKSTSISQLIGKTFHRVTSIVSGKTYEVETPSTLATVRGTVFGVDVAANQVSAVYVTESNVDVSQMEKKDGQRILKNTVKVEKDKEVVVVPARVSNKMEIKNMSQALRDDNWVKRNEMITEEVKKAENAPDKKPMMETLKEIKEKPELKKLDSPSTTMDKLYDTTLFTDVKITPSPSPTPTITSDTTTKIDTTLKLSPSPSPTPVLDKSTNIITKTLPTPSPSPEIKLTASPSPSSESKPGVRGRSGGSDDDNEEEDEEEEKEDEIDKD